MLVNGKTLVVTGAGNGIGREVTLFLIEKGSSVVGVDINKKGLEETKQMAGKHFSFYEVNIANKESVEELSKKIGEVDGIINNAGIIQPFVKVKDLDYEAIERVMGVNFYGTLYMVKSFLPALLRRSEAHIVNVSSMGGFLPVPGQSVYGASKAAVKLLTEGLYAELKDTNVGVTVVFPGATETHISENSGVKIDAPKDDSKAKSFPTLSPKKVAELIVGGIEKNKFRVCTGKDSKMMDRLYRLSPKFATNLIAKKMKSLLSDK